MSARETMTADASWLALADERVLARTIRELHYEGLLEPHALGEDDDAEHELVLGERLRYRFRARRSAWGDLHVVPGSVVRELDGLPSAGERPRAARFLLDAREVLGLRSIVLGNLLEELHNTIAAEAEQCRRLEAGAAALSRCRGVELEQHLDGHPKIIGSRGRIGWGFRELQAYAPELGARFRVVWLAARGGAARECLAPGLSRAELLRRTLGDDEHARLLEAARVASVDPEHDVLFPAHPWQWDRFVRLQYAAELANGRLVHLGEHGGEYRPRASIRTLAHATRPQAPDLKLSLSIMNTSCYRGIAAQHVALGGALSQATAAVVERDALLRAAGTVVLRDLGGVHYSLPSQAEAGGPYRYQELLGAIWRQSVASVVDANELQEVPAAAFYQRDLAGDPLVRHWVERSGWTAEEWLLALFRRTIVPLYHLLCGHGLSVIAHGQNIAVLLREGRPEGMVLRDFHGDVRLVSEPWPEEAGLPPDVTHAVGRRPVAELVHDLFTGHFVSVLRFVAPVFDRDLGVPEARFYRLVMQVIREYTAAHPELRDRFSAAALDRPQMERVCVNRARFRIGYGDLEHRPLPDLGPPLTNPLAQHSRTT